MPRIPYHYQLKLLFTALVKRNCHFIFDGKHYDQIDGVAMGSPLGPLFANIFLSFHEKEWLDNCPDSFKPIFFCRYVDDSFVLFNSHDHIVPFLDYLNLKHPNIKFTFEIENDNKTPHFLDISIQRVNGKNQPLLVFLQILKVFYRLLTKKVSFSLFCFFISTSATHIKFHAELEKFKKLLLQNGYPKFFIDRCVKTFLDKMISPPLKVQTPTVSKLLIPIVLPYTGNHAIQIHQQLHKLFSSAFPQVQLRVIF